MNQGVLTMILRYLFRNLCSISMFELEAVPHSWTSQAQMGVKITLYSNLFAIRCGAASNILLN